MAQFPDLPQDIRSTQVVVRFGLRMIILIIFATFGGIGFGKSLTTLLWMTGAFSAIVGIVRREPLFGTTLNHWDETAAYAALCCLVTAFNHAASF